MLIEWHGCVGGLLLFQAVNGKPTLKVAFLFFSGVKRKASIDHAAHLLCEKAGFGLAMHEVDILVGGDQHDLMTKSMQASWMARVEAGEFDCGIYSPPCGSWTGPIGPTTVGPSRAGIGTTRGAFRTNGKSSATGL